MPAPVIHTKDYLPIALDIVTIRQYWRNLQVANRICVGLRIVLRADVENIVFLVQQSTYTLSIRSDSLFTPH